MNSASIAPLIVDAPSNSEIDSFYARLLISPFVSVAPWHDDLGSAPSNNLDLHRNWPPFRPAQLSAADNDYNSRMLYQRADSSVKTPTTPHFFPLSVLNNTMPSFPAPPLNSDIPEPPEDLNDDSDSNTEYHTPPPNFEIIETIKPPKELQLQAPTPATSVFMPQADQELKNVDRNSWRSKLEDIVKPIELPNGRHKCPECDKCYKYRKHVRRHFLSHTNFRPFRCKYCCLSFRRLDSCSRHHQRCTFRKYSDMKNI